MNEFKPIAQRIVNAENDFIEVLMERGSLSKGDAVKAMRTMLKLKVAKLDAVSGRISVKHGAYLEADAIKRAAQYGIAERPKPIDISNEDADLMADLHDAFLNE